MPLFSLSFLVGVCGILFFSAIPPLFILMVAFLWSFVFYFLKKNKKRVLFIGMMGGCCLVMWFAHQRLCCQLPLNVENKQITLIGFIASIPKIEDGNVSFVFRPNNKQNFPEGFHVKRIKLSWYRTDEFPCPGQEWQLTVKLKRPHGFANPGGFDYEAYLFEENIGATGYVMNAADHHLIKTTREHYPITRLRYRLQNELFQLFKDQELSGFLSALIVGNRDYITDQQWDILRKTGTNHLIAIAGLHIGIVIGLVFFLIHFLWRQMPALTLKIPSPIVAAIFSLMAAIFYALLAGFPIQTQRALIMASVFLSAIILKRYINHWHSYFLALLFVLIVNPLNVMLVGFWMSFIAVGVILYAMNDRTKWDTKSEKTNNQFLNLWNRLGKVQCVIMVGLIPITLFVFHEISFVSPIANIIAVPWFALVIVPLCFFGALFLLINKTIAYGLLWMALKNLQVLWSILEKLSQTPILSWHHVIRHLIILFLSMTGVFLLLMPKKTKWRFISILFFIPLMMTNAPTPKLGEIWLTVLDVGQGLATVVQTQHHVLIYDAGPKFSEHFDAGNAVILPYLDYNDIHHVDRLVISHGDEDHIGGANSILQTMKVDSIYSSVPERLREDAEYCLTGQYWDWDGVHFEMLNPSDKQYEGNNSSCVLKISNGKQSLLLTGDIEKQIERALIQNNPYQLSSAILVAPHHGSITSSSPLFVNHVHPQWVIFSTGYLNRFHFPSKTVIQRYEQIGAKPLNTAYSGAIEIDLKDRMTVSQYRITNKKIWR